MLFDGPSPHSVSDLNSLGTTHEVRAWEHRQQAQCPSRNPPLSETPTRPRNSDLGVTLRPPDPLSTRILLVSSRRQRVESVRTQICFCIVDQSLHSDGGVSCCHWHALTNRHTSMVRRNPAQRGQIESGSCQTFWLFAFAFLATATGQLRTNSMFSRGNSERQVRNSASSWAKSAGIVGGTSTRRGPPSANSCMRVTNRASPSVKPCFSCYNFDCAFARTSCA